MSGTFSVHGVYTMIHIADSSSTLFDSVLQVGKRVGDSTLTTPFPSNSNTAQNGGRSNLRSVATVFMSHACWVAADRKTAGLVLNEDSGSSAAYRPIYGASKTRQLRYTVGCLHNMHEGAHLHFDIIAESYNGVG